MTNNKYSAQQNDVEITPGDHITVRAKNKYQDALIKQFTSIGRIETKNEEPYVPIHPETIDVFQLMATIHKKNITTQIMHEITRNMNYKTNEATLTKLTSKNLSKRRSEGLRELKKNKAIKKIGQRSFIVNPYLIIPPVQYQKKVIEKWNITKPISFGSPEYTI